MRAYYQVLTSSGMVLRAVNGLLVETQPDGTENRDPCHSQPGESPGRGQVQAQAPGHYSLMTAVQPRLRMFAGPNGSGKSTLKEVLDQLAGRLRQRR